MNAIERGLSRPIPLDKAASFFVGLKDFGKVTHEDDALMAECVKQAAADRAPQKVPLHEEAPADSAQTDPQPFLNVKSASLRFKLLGRTFMKTAGDETAASEDASAATISSPTPAAVPAQAEYLANEQAGMAAEEQSAVEYYQARLEEARAQAAAATEQAAQAQQQVEQLTAEQEAHQQQLSAAQQEGQIAQQAAMQQVETANLAATQAMQQAVGASNQALQAKGQEAAAKIEVQGVRSQLFDLASQGLPGTEPELGGEGGAAGGMEPLAPQEVGAEGAEGAPGEEAPAEGGAPVPGSGEGTEGAPAEGGDVPTTDAEQGATASSDGIAEQEEAPAPEGTPAEAAPGAVPPGAGGGGTGGGASAPPQANASEEGQPAPRKPTGQVSIKVGSAISKGLRKGLDRTARVLSGSTARAWQGEADRFAPQLGEVGRAAVGNASKERALTSGVRGALAGGALAGAAGVAAGKASAESRREKLAAAMPELFKTASTASTVGALAGGALGAGAAGLEAAGHGPDLDKMRASIAEREAAPKRPGLRGFADALLQVEEKMRLGLGEATRAHPIPATIAGGIGGATVGASAGPKIADLVRQAASFHRGA